MTKDEKIINSNVNKTEITEKTAKWSKYITYWQKTITNINVKTAHVKKWTGIETWKASQVQNNYVVHKK